MRSRVTALLAVAALALGAAACDETTDDAGVGPGAETGVDMGDEEMGDPATGEDATGDPADPDSELEGAED